MKKLFTLVLLLMVSVSALFSQKDWSVSDGALLDGKNIIKVNLTGLPIRNFGFYGERIINNRFSAVLGVNVMPKGGIPFINSFTSSNNNNDETIQNMKVNTFALTPELRIYTGSGYGKGFYFAPYFKYEQFGLSDLSVTFTDNDVDHEVIMDGKLKTYSGGLMIGYQWLLGKHKNIVLDWSILGLHGGKSSGNVHGYYATGTMTEEQQQEVKNNIDDALSDIPVIKYTTTVDEKNVSVDLTGPWAFFRMGLSIGYRF
ncbi:conserved exported hypothetical protein [uncultured Paludibacter sp.]|uniref:DUF3575 domain-containing protein n=1 Tax=uncultured Paludibacter sp. TaxID=497635 RepID=A0A653AGV3_9BACT|nr:conserved exported hypothetical protein [uncultured Paludibacter sp.]